MCQAPLSQHPHTTPRENQEYVEVLQKPVKIVQISIQLLWKVIYVKTKYIKKSLISNCLKNFEIIIGVGMQKKKFGPSSLWLS